MLSPSGRSYVSHIFLHILHGIVPNLFQTPPSVHAPSFAWASLGFSVTGGGFEFVKHDADDVCRIQICLEHIM